MANDFTDETFLLKVIACLMAVAITLLTVFTLSAPTTTEIRCTRSPLAIECNLLRNNSSIRIPNPIAVDITETHNKGNILYKAEMRAKNVSYTVVLASGYDFLRVRSVAQAVNDFLFSSNAPVLTIKSPEKSETNNTAISRYLIS
jgi:hypothetical protein